MSDRSYLSSIGEVIEDARNGRMFILVDDEARENEGDLVVPAQMATPDAINFMATHGRGLICLAMTPERVAELGLPPMTSDNRTRHQTAFTVSIEARDGVTTGISAPDRARTVAVAIDPARGKDEIVTPGHVFPLVAREGGVLVRAGHTEAAVDVARLAGLNPSGVICEIMKDDGTMARIPDLVPFAQFHGLKIATIADLIAYRRRYDHLVERVEEWTFDSRFGGEFRTIAYLDNAAGAEHLALVRGEIDPARPVMVRMHALSVFNDLLGDKRTDRVGELQASMKMIAREGRGVIVLIRQPWVHREPQAVTNGDPRTAELRDYGVGAQILLDIGVKSMILLSNSQRTVIGLEGYGLSIVERRPITVGDTAGDNE